MTQRLVLLEDTGVIVDGLEEVYPLFEITLDDDILDQEEFSELLCDYVNDYLEEQHQVLVDELPDSLLNE